MNDHKIVELIRSNRHNKAVRAIFKYFPSVRKIVKQHNGTIEDAEDVFQESLVILYKNLEDQNFQLTSSLHTYIVGISKNVLRDKKRVIQKQNSSEEKFLEIQEKDSCHQDDSKRKIALQSIESLGQKCLDILQSYYFYGMSMEDIAQKFNYASSKSAKNQKYKCLERARKKARELTESKTSAKTIWS